MLSGMHLMSVGDFRSGRVGVVITTNGEHCSKHRF
jgi:hypothetical protein